MLLANAARQQNCRGKNQCTPNRRVGLGVGSHVLNDPGLAAFNVRNAVLVGFRAGVHIDGFVDGSGEIGLGSLAGQVGARNFDLQTWLVRRCSDYVKILCVHCLVYHLPAKKADPNVVRIRGC